jgi:hypothetical protein
MSMTEYARAPFSLVDEINQVRRVVGYYAVPAFMGITGYGSTG